MNTTWKLALLAGSAAGSILAPAMALAADATDSARVEEVVVTAEKREQNVKDVPQSVTALSGGALDTLRATNFEDYITQVPGAILVSSQPGSSRLVLRGINTGGVSSTIATYVDETPYGSVTGLANGAVLAPDLDTFDMQRVEVLRGPQGTLYGASSLGGLLKYVTNPPDPTRYAGKIEVDGTDTDHGGLGGSVKGVFNAPLGDRAAIRIGGYYDDEPGFINDPLRHADHVNENKFSGARLSLLVKPTDRLTMRLSAVGQDITSRGTSTIDIDPATLQTLHGDLTQSTTFASPNKVAYRVYDLNVAYDMGFAKLTSVTSYSTLRQDSNGDLTPLYGGLLSAFFNQSVGAGIEADLKQRKFTQEVRVASGPQKFEWLVGGFFTHELNTLNQSINGINLVDPPQVPTGLSGAETVHLPSRYTEYAGFANFDYHFTDRFDLSAGGRYSHNEQHTLQVLGGPLAGGTSELDGSSSEGVFTFAVAPKYRINDDLTAYARIAKGYRPGGPNVVDTLAPSSVPRTFASDSLINYEVGIKADAFDHRVQFDVTGFYIDWSRIQLFADIDNFGVNANGGSAESKGVEADVTYVPVNGLTLSANGAYIQANLTQDAPVVVGGLKGDRLPYSPHISGAVNADYRHEISTNTSLFFGGSVRVTGQRYSDFNPSPAVNHLSLPAYATVDLRAGVDVRKIRIEFYVKNLNDARGLLNVGGYGNTPERRRSGRRRTPAHLWYFAQRELLAAERRFRVLKLIFSDGKYLSLMTLTVVEGMGS